MKLIQRFSFTRIKLLLLTGGLVLLLMLVVQVQTASANGNVVTVASSVRDTMVTSMLALGEDYEGMSCVDIPKPPKHKSPFRPPGWNKWPKPPGWKPPGWGKRPKRHRWIMRRWRKRLERLRWFIAEYDR